MMRASVVWGVISLVAALAGCTSNTDASSESDLSSKEARWAAAAVSRDSLGVEQWAAVDRNDGNVELFGYASDSANVIVHAYLERQGDGRLKVDVDRPAAWTLEYRPGDLPITGGAMPPEVVVGLLGAVLDMDADTGVAAPLLVRSATTTVKGLRTLAEDLTGFAEPLLACSSQLLDLREKVSTQVIVAKQLEELESGAHGCKGVEACKAAAQKAACGKPPDRNELEQKRNSSLQDLRRRTLPGR